MNGVYPLPLRLFPRVDTRDVGDAAARALLDPNIPSGGYALVGPESLSGAQSAAHWSVALGWPVHYAPDMALTDQLPADNLLAGSAAAQLRRVHPRHGGRVGWRAAGRSRIRVGSLTWRTNLEAARLRRWPRKRCTVGERPCFTTET